MTDHDFGPAVERLLGPPPESWGGPPRTVPPRTVARHHAAQLLPQHSCADCGLDFGEDWQGYHRHVRMFAGHALGCAS